ncbi:MAG TPA: zinc-binding alcohol dehydrogenase family protein [Candidatus Acidoferrales bacterium]|nr:zinc-binding alcohol dehydrogenase family protein [Candidatus Acidoferrales bacterium]
MNAAVLRSFGNPPRFEEFPEPIPSEDEAIVHVRAAALKPVDKQLANGSHYARPRELPAVCGSDGVGNLVDGTRVFFGGPRPPHGAMAQRTVVPRAFCFPIPEAVDDDTAAALPNPGISAWLSLTWRANLAPGETVLILGATGVTGKLAVQIAKRLGAGRVIVAGRSEQVLSTLGDLGADSAIQLDRPDEELTEAFRRAAGDTGFQVIIDYLWGHPTEVLLAAITRSEFAVITSETRLVQAGESAGTAISLPAAVLRSRALTILGTAGIPPRDVLGDAYKQVMQCAARGELRVDTERVPLADVEGAWQREVRGGRRVVIIP